MRCVSPSVFLGGVFLSVLECLPLLGILLRDKARAFGLSLLLGSQLASLLAQKCTREWARGMLDCTSLHSIQLKSVDYIYPSSSTHPRIISPRLDRRKLGIGYPGGKYPYDNAATMEFVVMEPSLLFLY